MPILRFQLRRGTAAEWASANPILGGGEPGLETDTGKVKYGDGVNAWSLRPYSSLTQGEMQQLLDTTAGSAAAAAGSAGAAASEASLAQLARGDAETARTQAQAARDAAQAVPTTTDGLVKGLLDNPASETVGALNATFGPAAQAASAQVKAAIQARVDTEFHDSFAGKANGVPTVGDTGQAYTIYPQTGNRVPTIRNGKLSFATDNPGATTFGSGGYANITTSRPITHADASFTLTPWANVGGLACLALMTNPMVGTVWKSPAHLIVAPEYWSFGVFTTDGSAIVILKQVNYKTNLVADGVKVYTMSVDIDRVAGIAYVSVPYPDGTQQTFAIQHDAIKTPAYAAYIEPYQGTNPAYDYSLAEFTEWNLGTGTSRAALRAKEINSRQEQETVRVYRPATNQTLTTSFVSTGATIGGVYGKTGKCLFRVQVPVQVRGACDLYFVLNDGANGNVGTTNTRAYKGRPTVVDTNDKENRILSFMMDAAGEPGKEFNYTLNAVAFGVAGGATDPQALILTGADSGAGYNIIISSTPY
jgi:hypothetical protein